MDLPGSTDIALGSPLSVCDTTRHNLWYSLAGLAHRPQKKISAVENDYAFRCDSVCQPDVLQ
jgi:hypothetical protein